MAKVTTGNLKGSVGNYLIVVEENGFLKSEEVGKEGVKP
ncbi:hypothetical protein J2X69_001903 [Algoriphagus sp. 4150]|nr:hypothetical protein [Algoriphagus sp. 4150]